MSLILITVMAVALGLLFIDSFRSRRTRGKSPNYIGDAANQLRIVMNSEFGRKPIMSRGEHAVFKQVRLTLKDFSGYQVFPQASLGEVLSAADERAFRCINGKRVDLLVIDNAGLPRVAIEVQGDGHYQGDAAARDAVKREALRRAGVRYVEVFSDHAPADVHRLLTEALRGSPTPPPQPWGPRPAPAGAT